MTTDPPTGPPCGNNPNHPMTDGDRDAVEKFKAYLATRTEQRATRDRIRHAIANDWRANHCFELVGEPLDPDEFGSSADAVLDVLPAPTDRAVVLREAADRYEAMLAKANTGQDPRYWTAVRDMTLGLRRMADETQEPDAEAPLSPYMSHPACGFHWHGRDGMDVPIRDGQPVCPRCELRTVRATSLREAADVAARWVSDCQSCAVELEVASALRRMANETQQAEPWLSDSSRIGRTLIWTHAELGKGAYGQGYRDAQEQVRKLLTGSSDAETQQP